MRAKTRRQRAYPGEKYKTKAIEKKKGKHYHDRRLQAKTLPNR
jgi:hypothetical protein